jgi:uncharacterized protein involved in cysteine biosynthesis
VILLLFILLFCIALLCLLVTFFFFTIITSVFSVPYVPTSTKDIERVLDYAKLKKGMQFVDLGSGDGKVIIKAVQKYMVVGTGTELNPLLVWISRIWAKLLKLEGAVFLRQDMFSFPLDNAHVVYLFLLPRMMEKMSAKLKKECGKGTLIISRGFEIPGLTQVQMIPTKTFETFFYRV